MIATASVRPGAGAGRATVRESPPSPGPGRSVKRASGVSAASRSSSVATGRKPAM